MSQSIDKVKVQIPGTMYYLELAADRGRWILSLLLREDVENEVIVPVFSKNGINKAANELLSNSRLVIDKYPLKNVCDQLFAEAERSLPITTPIPKDDSLLMDPEVMKQKFDLLESSIGHVTEELKESLNEITERIKALEKERVNRLESEVNNREVKGQEEIIQSLSDRVEKIEESSAKTTTDERIPSILTAIEALESKVAQIEGKAVTVESTEVDLTDYSSFKAELGRLAKAFDLINQRLTALELKLKS